MPNDRDMSVGYSSYTPCLTIGGARIDEHLVLVLDVGASHSCSLRLTTSIQYGGGTLHVGTPLTFRYSVGNMALGEKVYYKKV